jgi:hypothetical protein
MIPLDEFPRLTDANHRLTSPESNDYNCIAWAADDIGNWWQPGVYWPIPVDPEETSLSALQAMFTFLGYEPCASGALESGFIKVALYSAGKFYTHAARQLPSGKWTSKLGKGEDIEHDSPDDVAGGIYGDVALYMMRPTP